MWWYLKILYINNVKLVLYRGVDSLLNIFVVSVKLCPDLRVTKPRKGL